MRTESTATLLLLLLITASSLVASDSGASGHEFPRDGRVMELDESNFDDAIAAFDFILVDFFAPWCGHCKRLNPELDAAAPVLAALSEPIFVAKINADKYTKLASKYEIDGFPTMKIFMHGAPVEYMGPRKADLLVRYLKKFVAPDVTLLESDSAIQHFVEATGANFPIFIGFSLDESVIVEAARRYKKNAWFAVAKGFSEEMMIAYDLDKVPALLSLHPKYNEQNLFYGPFDGDFLGDFIQQNQLPLVVPINFETLKSMDGDKRTIVLTIMENQVDDNSSKLIKILRSAATANKDLIFGYVGVSQWEDFADKFDVTQSTKLPKILLWNGNEEYHIVEGLENLEDNDQGSQINRFLEGYRAGRIIKKKIRSPSLLQFINLLVSMNTVYLIIFVVALFVVIQMVSNKGADVPMSRRTRDETAIAEAETQRSNESADKED